MRKGKIIFLLCLVVIGIGATIVGAYYLFDLNKEFAVIGAGLAATGGIFSFIASLNL